MHNVYIEFKQRTVSANHIYSYTTSTNTNNCMFQKEVNTLTGLGEVET